LIKICNVSGALAHPSTGVRATLPSNILKYKIFVLNCKNIPQYHCFTSNHSLGEDKRNVTNPRLFNIVISSMA